MSEVQVTRRKGRIGGALIGTLLFPGVGTILGAAIGTRSETVVKDKPTFAERAAANKELQAQWKVDGSWKYRKWLGIAVLVFIAFAVLSVIYGPISQNTQAIQVDQAAASRNAAAMAHNADRAGLGNLDRSLSGFSA